MSPQYYVPLPDGTKEGPFTVEEIRARLASGALRFEDTIEDSETGGQVKAESLGQSQSQPEPEAQAAKGPPPVTALVIGICLLGLVVVTGVVAVIVQTLARFDTTNRQNETLSALRDVGVAMMSYTSDYDDTFPPGMADVDSVWPELRRYGGSEPKHSSNPAGATLCGNVKLAGLPVSSVAIPRQTYEFFDSVPWKDGVRYTLFVDGHAARVPGKRFADARANGFLDKGEQ